MNKTLITAVLSSLAMGSAALSETYEVEVGSTYYDPQWLHVEPGDVINWTRVGGTHNVISGEQCSSPDGVITSPTLNGTNPFFSWTVPSDASETIEYYCSVGGHCTSGNQYGALILGGNGVTHVITTNGFAYEPAELSVNPGDTVIWEHGGGTHTVTFGEDCVSDGGLNESLSSTNAPSSGESPKSLPAAPRTTSVHRTAGLAWSDRLKSAAIPPVATATSTEMKPSPSTISSRSWANSARTAAMVAMPTSTRMNRSM